MTRGLSETLLATIGVVVLTLLASLVKGEANGAIFRIGMRIYAVYIAAVHLVYRMLGIWHSYRLMWREWEGRVAEYRRILGPQRIKGPETDVKSRRVQFRLWFWVTVILYIVVAVTIWKLPELLPPGILGQPGKVPGA